MFCKDKKKTILFVFNKEKEHPIHSFFVPYDFHAIYLNKEMKVLEKYYVKPGKSYICNKKPAKYLLESYEFEYEPKVGERLKCSDGKF